jgi:hypothetical protein
MVVHICNSNTQEMLRQEDSEFKASLGHVTRPYLGEKTKQNGGK